MKHVAAFLAGLGCCVLLATPLSVVAFCALLHTAAVEADQRAAKSLMRQLRAGIVECRHVGRTFNCTETRRGRSRAVTLAVASTVSP